MGVTSDIWKFEHTLHFMLCFTEVFSTKDQQNFLCFKQNQLIQYTQIQEQFKLINFTWIETAENYKLLRKFSINSIQLNANFISSSKETILLTYDKIFIFSMLHLYGKISVCWQTWKETYIVIKSLELRYLFNRYFVIITTPLVDTSLTFPMYRFHNLHLFHQALQISFQYDLPHIYLAVRSDI